MSAPRSKLKIGWKPKAHDESIASVRYRCLLPMSGLNSSIFDSTIFDSRDLSSFDVLIFSKLYDRSSQKEALAARSAGVKTILDLCDNHLYNPRGLEAYDTAAENLKTMIGIVDYVVCSSAELANQLTCELNLKQRPFIVGDPIETLPETKSFCAKDLKFIEQVPDDIEGWWAREKTLLWFGSHGSPNATSGMEDLLLISELLDRLRSSYKFKLIVASNSLEKFETVSSQLSIECAYVEWNFDSFKSVLESADCVIIPISRNDFNLCKTNNRLVMSLAHGVPVVADGIPSYMEFDRFTFLDKWDQGLRSVLDEDPKVSMLTQDGKKYVHRHYSLSESVKAWESVLSVVGML